MKVLVVDDSKFMRNIIIDIFNKNNISVVGEASNGREAIKKYIELNPEIVTMDLTMEETDGITAIEEIIKLDAKAYIIACSAMGQQTIIREAIVAGAKGFVVKPFEDEDLIREVRKYQQLKE
ncbi:response regulator [Clostridium sp. DJ247]|uniref:response regulator n=1 Tax=Clostridium sp. DJ247 TaxID=2726188 RepID=UPI0016268D15|nr:response regulator [Clostridium sp. DJ247]MBC2581000.1 response regulator [Clostridium sp. DJ247]